MGITRTLGGDRLGSGKKMKVHMHGYERSTHNLSYLWRSTMSAGTLVPFMKKLALPGDTWDIDLECRTQTHPTVGPLFGTDKIQLDVFVAPIRLYQGLLHNNKLGIGMNMANVKLPYMDLATYGSLNLNDIPDLNTLDINPSCILHYLGISGIGNATANYESEAGFLFRKFNAVPILAYWDIFKNYYANKMEENAYVIHTDIAALVQTIDQIDVNTLVLVKPPTGTPQTVITGHGSPIRVMYTGATPLLNQIMISTSIGNIMLSTVLINRVDTAGEINGQWMYTQNLTIYGWDYVIPGDNPIGAPTLKAFPLTDIDEMRERILQLTSDTNAVYINNPGGTGALEPWASLLQNTATQTPYKYSQEGLAVKTYQSDLLNNWLNEEWIDGTNGINEITAIDTSGGSFTIDTLNLSKKIYLMLNRIAVSGGTYYDWIEVQYDQEVFAKTETPTYHGGLIRELAYQEVISNSESVTTEGAQPLGTLGGRGVLTDKKKGGRITIKVMEPSYIMGIVSITPRIDNSQGNDWDTTLQTLDDLHVPALDEIGFQDLITERMAWWDTTWNTTTNEWEQHSAGKQPAWIEYMTSINEVHGNFAIADNEMFMTRNRRYEITPVTGRIADLTTYIDPVKFNYSFAQTALDAQNYWMQIAVNIEARRKMSAKLIPNL